MAGTERIFVNSMGVVQSWHDFKIQVINEFDRRKTLGDIYRQLGDRKRGKEESFHHYILSMTEIATQGVIDEIEVVRFIVDGLNDRSPNAAMLYAATTIRQLKDSMDNYDYHRGRANVRGSSAIKTKSSGNDQIPLSQVRCYNCNSVGHYQSSCAKDKMVKGACYTCNQSGHISHIPWNTCYDVSLQVVHTGVMVSYHLEKS